MKGKFGWGYVNHPDRLLLLVTGNYMRPGCGAYPLRGHNNVQGASDIGAMPDNYPGYQHVSNHLQSGSVRKSCGVKVPAVRGFDNDQMVEAVYDGKLGAIYLAGEGMISADSNANVVAGAFEKLDFFVVQDNFFSEICRYADVVLPGAPALEKEGTSLALNGAYNGCIKPCRNWVTARPIGRSRRILPIIWSQLELSAPIGNHE